MLFDATARLNSYRPRCTRLFAVALLVGLSAGSGRAATTVQWHASLPDAQRASQFSGRPVLAIFTASWMAEAAAIDRTALASAEAVAVVAACYEPVCVDVDAQPEATRLAGVSRVPTACVLTIDGCVLSKFELPETPAEFAAAAARAAQEAAFAAANGSSTSRTAATDRVGGLQSPTRLPVPTSTSVRSDGFETRPLAAGQARGVVPPSGRAITAVAAKVRMLSDFASTDCPTTAEGNAVAAAFRDVALQQPAVTAPPTAVAKASPPATPAASTNGPTPPAAAAVAETTSGPATTAPTSAATGDTNAAVTSEALARNTAETPLDMEAQVAATTASTPAAAQAGGAAPWLGLPEAAPAIAPASPEPVAVAAAAPPAKVIEPQPSAAEKPADPAKPEAQASQPAAPAATAASSLLATLQKPFTMFTRPAAPRKDQAAAASPATAETAAPATPAEPDSYGSMPVGLEGYCPVMLAERGVWVEGRAQWGVRHRGRTYLFAGEQQQKAFLADPDRYAPALSGDDPVLAFDSGKSTPGQRRYGVTYQSRMYLFSSPETRDAFAANPQRYTAGALVAENRGTSMAAGGSAVR